MEWISVKERLPECKDWDIDREAFFSKKVFTWSSVHGAEVNFLRKDDIYVDSYLKLNRQSGMTHKWGVRGDDLTITHWAIIEPPKQ